MIARVEHGMPAMPSPYALKDWRAVACAFDRLAFDPAAQGEYLPLLRWDEGRVNFDRTGFGLPSYVGDPRAEYEAITCLGAVLGATLAGIDKAQGPHDWVRMAEQYYNRGNGENLVLNRTFEQSGQSYWYELWPHILFYALADRYPDPDRDAIMRRTADRWWDACRRLSEAQGVPDFNHTAFDFGAMRPVDNGRWREPDAAAGVAWLEYMAWAKWREPEYLEAAEGCLRFLQERQDNPHYEVLLSYGALAAARRNAERGRVYYDVPKLVNWCFESSAARPGWGVMAENWGGYDCHGLVGGIADGGGYAFAMNTFAMAGALVPLVRYDTRFAHAIGRWMLHAASNARLFYPDAHPAERQSCPSWKGDPDACLCYEGLRARWEGQSPYATGDALRCGWARTDFAVYGSAYAGFFGGIVRPTNLEAVLMLDCLATDFFRGPAYPTYLCYNPHRAAVEVETDVGPQPRDLYDAASGRFLTRDVRGRSRFRLAADTAAIVVLTPAGGTETREGGMVRMDGVVVRYFGGEYDSNNDDDKRDEPSRP